MAADDRIGVLWGRVTEQAAAIADLQETRRNADADLTGGFRDVNARIDGLGERLNTRIDRLFLAMLGIGAAQIALLVTLVIRGA